MTTRVLVSGQAPGDTPSRYGTASINPFRAVRIHKSSSWPASPSSRSASWSGFCWSASSGSGSEDASPSWSSTRSGPTCSLPAWWLLMSGFPIWRSVWAGSGVLSVRLMVSSGSAQGPRSSSGLLKYGLLFTAVLLRDVVGGGPAGAAGRPAGFWCTAWANGSGRRLVHGQGTGGEVVVGCAGCRSRASGVVRALAARHRSGRSRRRRCAGSRCFARRWPARRCRTGWRGGTGCSGGAGSGRPAVPVARSGRGGCPRRAGPRSGPVRR